VQLLLDNGAAFDFSGGYGNPLMAACSTGDTELVQRFLERYADINHPGRGLAGAGSALERASG
jgi:hypothetical protein